MTDPTGGPEKVIESFRVFDSTKSGMVDLKTVRDVMVSMYVSSYRTMDSGAIMDRTRCSFLHFTYLISICNELYSDENGRTSDSEGN